MSFTDREFIPISTEHWQDTHGYGVLSDRSIRECVERGIIVIEPFDLAHLQAASYDLSLSQDLVLKSGKCALADTIERIVLPAHIRGKLCGRSSIARHFVFFECSGGLVDPGFPGTLTLEAFNASRKKRKYKRGDRVIQIEFAWLDRPAEHPYQGRYANQSGPTKSKFEHGDG